MSGEGGCSGCLSRGETSTGMDRVGCSSNVVSGSRVGLEVSCRSPVDGLEWAWEGWLAGIGTHHVKCVEGRLRAPYTPLGPRRIYGVFERGHYKPAAAE